MHDKTLLADNTLYADKTRSPSAGDWPGRQNCDDARHYALYRRCVYSQRGEETSVLSQGEDYLSRPLPDGRGSVGVVGLRRQTTCPHTLHRTPTVKEGHANDRSATGHQEALRADERHALRLTRLCASTAAICTFSGGHRPSWRPASKGVSIGSSNLNL